MPQGSLLGWLSKPSSVQKPPATKLPETRAQVDNVPTVHREQTSSSQDFVSARLRNNPGETRCTEQVAKDKRQVLPSNVELRACTKEDIPQLKRLNALLLPVPYPEKFYREIIEDPLTNDITLVAVWHDDPETPTNQSGKLVGAIRCRLLAHPPSSNAAQTRKGDGPMLYLSTLVLLSPYRAHGIATRMLQILTKRAITTHGITSVGAHVWEANHEGLEWYRKRGFREVGRERDYYRRLKPSGAVVVQRDLGIMELIGD